MQPAETDGAAACETLPGQSGSCRRFRSAVAARPPRSGPSAATSAHLAEIDRISDPSDVIFRLIEAPSQEDAIATAPGGDQDDEGPACSAGPCGFPMPRRVPLCGLSIGSVSYLTPFASHASAGSVSQPDDERQDFREHLTGQRGRGRSRPRFPACRHPHEIAEMWARGGSEGEPRTVLRRRAEGRAAYDRAPTEPRLHRGAPTTRADRSPAGKGGFFLTHPNLFG